MPELEYHEQEGLTMNDVLFILRRHQWKILGCTLVGLLVAAVVYLLNCQVYESQAKLLVRYVMDKSAVDALESQPDKAVGAPSENLINSEVEILSSWDLAEQVVDALSLKRMQRNTGDVGTRADAARNIMLNLKVTPPKASNVITLSYKNRDPELARAVLEKLVTLYFEKHLDVHRSAGAFEFVHRESEQVRERLHQTEEASNKLKAQAGILTLSAGTASLDSELAKNQYALFSTDVERAEQQARIAEIEKGFPKMAADLSEIGPGANRSADDGVQRYQALVTKLAQLRQGEVELLAKYTPENRVVQIHQAQLEVLQNQVREMERRNPGLAQITPWTGSAVSNTQPNLSFERARLAGLNAKSEMLKNQLQSLRERAENLSILGPQIAELDRKKQVDEANYKYFGASLEKARIDEALDPSKIPNISVVQKPSPALQATGKLKKIVAGLIGGGLAAGVLLALIIDLVLDRTVKRPTELERQLKIPLLLSVPLLKGNRRRLRESKGAEIQLLEDPGSELEIAPWDQAHFIRAFCEAIRDRLQLELSRSKHQTKLVAVTGCSNGAGASTLASGLSAAFSEIGDGKVLLVDMNVNSGEAHPFFSGLPVCSLAEALEAGGPSASADGNLYLASVQGAGSRLIPKRLHEWIPRLKASDYDYILFDMPAMGPTSTTLAMAALMDKTLLVVEAGVSSRETIERAYFELRNAKVSVSVVFNKACDSSPEWLEA